MQTKHDCECTCCGAKLSATVDDAEKITWEGAHAEGCAGAIALRVDPIIERTARRSRNDPAHPLLLRPARLAHRLDRRLRRVDALPGMREGAISVSTGTLCLTCRKYIKGDARWICSCRLPIPSDDGVTPNATEAEAAAQARRSLPFRPGDIVEHRKGGRYRVEGVGTIEKTMTEAYAYRGHDGRLWFRPIAEMEDGRFKKVGHEPSTDNGAPMKRLFGAVTRLFAEINRAGPP
jgi:hypothetical protein